MSAATKVQSASGVVIDQIINLSRVHERVFVALIFLIIAILRMFILTRVPLPFVDEAWFASHAVGLLTTGRPFGPLDAGVFEQYDGHWTYFSWLGATILAIPISIFGLSIFSVRIPSLIFGLILLLSCYVIGRRLGDQLGGFLAIALVGFSPAFNYSANLARPDIVISAVGFGAIALVLADQTARYPVRSIIAGLIIGFAFEIHPNAVIYVFPILAILLLERKWEVFSDYRVYFFIAGSMIGPIAVVLLHILPYPETFLAITRIALGSTKVPPILLPHQWATAVSSAIQLLFAANPFLIPLTIFGAIIGILRRNNQHLRLVAVLIVLLIEFIALIPYWPVYYVILISPAADLVLASFLIRAGDWLHLRPRWKRIIPLLTGGIIVFNLASTLSFFRYDSHGEYQRIASHIRSVSLPNSKIMADPKYWFALSDYRFVGLNEIAYYRRHVSGSSIADVLQHYRPDIIILDASIENQLIDDPSGLDPWEQLGQIPRTELDQILASHGERAPDLNPPSLLNVRIYRLRWN